ncbi:hypothetical protein C8F04DRAFT_1248806 [Mycena alexandri]|uniref:Uncharacterized protein n=1 Tax=Mycena alexandri TaxID=1745969 RepID=A0AAD6XEI6_9AGAR|nr:hypothetical protein C8F04DRAFT_1248806 [Mycena alexandri]
MADNKDPSRVVAGLKSALARDNVSDEAKMHAEERLKEMGALDSQSSKSDNNASVDVPSDKSVAHAREIMEAAGYTFTDEDAKDEENEARVLDGYKAALTNPQVSEEAKKLAREYLKDRNAL